MKSIILTILAVPLVSLALVANSAASQSVFYSGKTMGSGSATSTFHHSGRWIDHRARIINRQHKEKSEMAVMETRENGVQTASAEKRVPTGWQGRRHDYRH